MTNLFEHWMQKLVPDLSVPS